MATTIYKFTIKERVWLIPTYYQENADYAQMFTDFTEHTPNAPISLRQLVQKWMYLVIVHTFSGCVKLQKNDVKSVSKLTVVISNT